MEFFRRAPGERRILGVFPGAFNPPTRAHIALARGALARVDEVVFVLPRTFPHKPWEGAGMEDRARMLECAAADPRFSIASGERGLFVDIARECRAAYGQSVELWFLCGADAAERIVNWDYGSPGAISSQLRDYGLLVAPRLSGWSPPPELEHAVAPLSPAEPCESFSSTAVRERIAAGQQWEYMVPEEIVEMVRTLYASASRR